MQVTYDASMPDTCRIIDNVPGAVDEYGNPTMTWTWRSVDVACGLDMRNSYEVLASTQVLVYDARLRLPHDTVVSNLCRIAVWKRYGVMLDTSLIFEAIGPPRQGAAGVQIDLKTVTSV